jgi:hypothetical protein
MAEPKKWTVNEDYDIFCGKVCIAHTCSIPAQFHCGKARTNANLIVAAVNACAAVNPSCPMAVAESIKDMYKAVKLWHQHQQGTRGHYCAECANALQNALFKAEGR